jgi:D-glycero-D-manno-heptose 1,7-bisphosphate phosphatase
MSLVDGIGLWCDIGDRRFAGCPAIFLDRDGVIVEDVNYLGRAQDVRMLPGAATAIARCNRSGIPVVVVTNQAGIGRGYYDWDDFHAVQAALVAALARSKAHLDAVLACAYHVEGNSAFRLVDHPWRKPNPGMILAAAEKMQLDLANSWIVGDRASDLASGKAASLRGGVLITTGQSVSEQTRALALADEAFVVDFSTSLADAVKMPIDHGLAGEGGKR